MSYSRSMQSALAVLACALPTGAGAHHAMDYATPASLFEGFVSGLAHPVIGLDHFLFVLAVGIASYYFGRRAATPLTFVAGAIGGAALHLYQPALAYHDAWVALSLVLLGVLFLAGERFLKTNAALALFALAGIAHGYAYGEAIIGAEPTLLVAYLAGFTLVQLAIIYAAFAAARYLDRTQPRWQAARAAGGVLSLAGVGFLLLSFA